MDPVATAAGASAGAVTTKVISTGLDGAYRFAISVMFLCWVSNIGDGLTPIAAIAKFASWLGISDIRWLDNVAVWLQGRSDGVGLAAVVVGSVAVWGLVSAKTFNSRAGTSLLLALILGAQVEIISWSGFALIAVVVAVVLSMCGKLQIIKTYDWMEYALGNLLLSVVASFSPILWLVGQSGQNREPGDSSWNPIHVNIANNRPMNAVR